MLTLATEGRRPRPRRPRRARACSAWSVPAARAWASRCCARSTRSTLQVAVTRRRARDAGRAPAARPPSAARRAAVGGARRRASAPGALVTSTNTSGPPLLLYLLGRGDEPERLRDTLTVCQLGLSVIGALALVVTGTSGAVPRAWLVAVFVPAGGARAHRRAAAVPAPRGERRLRAGAHRDPRRGRRDGPGDRAHLRPDRLRPRWRRLTVTG